MMKTTALGLAFWASVLAIPLSAQAQPLPELKCEELKEEAVAPIAALCKAHIGCGYVLNSHRRCADAKGYLERLQPLIGEGTKTLFGIRKEVTPDAVFTAVLGGEAYANARDLEERSPEAKETIRKIGEAVRAVGAGEVLTGRWKTNVQWVYYGQVRDGKSQGVGTLISEYGSIERGTFGDDGLKGDGDAPKKTTPNPMTGRKSIDGPARTVGRFIDGHFVRGQILSISGDELYLLDGAWSYDNGKQTFTGIKTYADGRRFEGRIVSSLHDAGRLLRADGTLAEAGNYEKGKLSVGRQYDGSGKTVIAEIDLPAERKAAEAKAEQDKLLQAQEQERRKQEAAAQAEQQFRASLQAMNAGQLFARADELNVQGDRTRAREVQRVLMSRFPDHPLTATTARQITSESGGSTAAGGGSSPAGTANAAGRPAGTRLSSQTCEAMKQTVMTTRVPPNASVTASTETVMFMTKTVLDMIAGGCPTDGTTPAQIEAERQERQRQYAAAESACNQVQSGGRRCVPQAHLSAGAVSKPPVASAANNARQSAVGYDPVTGRCLPVDSCECQQACGVPRSSSGGGGIRTAR